ncbi:NADPH-dependent FMN reductase [Flavisolibacter ginsenosidimutans]|uniref:NAD(P)H-dependent oxidoreductase n=1 Tax=Flavisolibacter ginsenosidimutans TaxID=661481 RepID=A0A5B8UG32_9BACT|nr:NADPH-dependent FMN reductase [Flavisolibacter ginsenosidimutans]QEC55458.1 NAD(P)H-dependent oxidoreductase [Flavisolibacter ginsenosidimutans]
MELTQDPEATTHTKNILAIIGSASDSSSNQKLVEHLSRLLPNNFVLTAFGDLKTLPHFDPKLSVENPPETVVRFREAVAKADGLIICTPEYVFSIPSGLKNAIEWCVATTVFSNKPTGLITASAQGERGHEELQLIMRTVMARFTDETCLLIQGIKGKISEDGNIKDSKTQRNLTEFAEAFVLLVNDTTAVEQQ